MQHLRLSALLFAAHALRALARPSPSTPRVAALSDTPCTGDQWPRVCPGTFPRADTQSWLMNRSTIIMPCNYTGMMDPRSVAHWSITDFDWSNFKGRGTADGWAKHKPMDDEEQLFKQIQMTAAETPSSTSWAYKNTIYGYAWVTEIRVALEDPAYAPWFLRFKDVGPWYSQKCDSANKSLCSDFYHSQEQSPGFPHGDGDCAAPACDCGTVPCGFYVFNHSSTVVVNGQSFQDWFVDSYMFNYVGNSSIVGGFFWDDMWSVDCNLHDQVPKTCEDMGLTAADLAQLTASYQANMAALRDKTLAAGKFAWQLLWAGGPDDNIATGKISTHVTKKGCAASLRALCNATAAPQVRAMVYGLSGAPDARGANLLQDLANFLLIRGKFAWLGWGFHGCSVTYYYPPEFGEDYGVPTGLCSETAPNSGVFRRDFDKSTITMDCTTYTPTITMK